MTTRQYTISGRAGGCGLPAPLGQYLKSVPGGAGQGSEPALLCMVFQNIASTPLPPSYMKLFSFPESVETLPSAFSWNSPTAICELGPGDQVTADSRVSLSYRKHSWLFVISERKKKKNRSSQKQSRPVLGPLNFTAHKDLPGPPVFGSCLGGLRRIHET